MLFIEANTKMFIPDVGGLMEFRVSGDQVPMIEQTIYNVYMQPPQEALDAYNKALTAYNEKYKDSKSIDNPNPPTMPAATGIPPDFFLLLVPEQAQQTGRAASFQEKALFKLYGTAAARQFLVEECGIQI